MPHMLGRIVRAARDQRGVETLEWMIVGVMITALAVFAYGNPSLIGNALSTAATTIGNRIASGGP